MSRWAGAIAVVVVLAGSAGFAVLNGGQRVTLDLGLATFRRVPVTWVAFGALLLGMLMMLAVDLRSDLRVRRILRDRLREEDRKERERTDRYQQDLFRQEESGDVDDGGVIVEE